MWPASGKTLYENIFGKRLPDDLRAQLSALAGETVRRDTSKAADGYASYLDELDLPSILGQPQYSQKQIRAMQDYTLDQLKDAICTVPDMIQYLVETNYGENPVWENDIHFSDGGYAWAINKSAAGALASDCPSCGAVSNLTRCILEGDYDDSGYILWGTYDKDKNETNGGHVINFYQIGVSTESVSVTAASPRSAPLTLSTSSWAVCTPVRVQSAETVSTLSRAVCGSVTVSVFSGSSCAPEAHGCTMSVSPSSRQRRRCASSPAKFSETEIVSAARISTRPEIQCSSTLSAVTPSTGKVSSVA